MKNKYCDRVLFFIKQLWRNKKSMLKKKTAFEELDF